MFLVLSTGCAIQAPPYAASVDNAERLKRIGTPIAVGEFNSPAGATGAASIGLRGASMESPVGGQYAGYLAEALRRELALAGLLDRAAQVRIDGLLVKNDISAAGISTNSGEIEARFTVLRGGVKKFDKQIRAELEWDSSFVGAIAVPKAQQQYPLLVQKLLSTLFADADFAAALK